MKFTTEDIESCWDYALSYLADILNDEYDLEEAKEDLQSLVGSEFDTRKIK